MHLSLPKQFPLFILASYVYKSLQCLISAMTQGGKGGHLFRLTCSVVLWGGRNTANKYHWHVWGVLAVSQPYWVCPHSWHVCFPSLHCSGSRFLCRKNCPKWPLDFMHFPRLSCSGSGSWVLHKGTDLFGPEFCPSQVQPAQATRCLVSTLFQLGSTSYYLPSHSPLVSWVCSKNAISGVPCVSSGELISH